MLQYLVILLDDISTSFCHYSVDKTERKLIPIEMLRKGILFAMKADLSVQFVYPSYKIPKEYLEVIDDVDHFNIMPASIAKNDADAIVVDEWEFNESKSFLSPLIIRTKRASFFKHSVKLKEALRHTNRIDVVLTDIDSFNEEDFKQYESSLNDLTDAVEQIYVDGLSPQLNILTDRMMLQNMNNCGAGDTTITLTPNGKFYICPAFYYEDEEDNVGDLIDGLDIKNKQLYKLDYAPICCHCDAWQCKRCIWLNRKITLEVNTPSHEQCVLAHLERNASRKLLSSIRQHGTFLPEFGEIRVNIQDRSAQF